MYRNISVSLVLTVGFLILGCNEKKSHNPKPMAPEAFVIHGDVNDYASFPEIVRTENELIVFYQVQPIEKLKQDGAHHSHYQLYDERYFAVSKDNGKMWDITRKPPIIKNVRDITRTYADLKNDKILDLRYRHKENETGFAPLHARIYRESLFANPEFKKNISKTWPENEKIWPWDLRKLKEGSLLAACYGPYKNYIPEKVIGGQKFKENWPEDYRHDQLFFLKGTPGGKDWKLHSMLYNDHPFSYGEPSFLEFENGRIVCVMRTRWSHKIREFWPAEVNGNGLKRDGVGYWIYQTESNDGGNTWTEPKRLDIWGHPPYLLKLKSGNVLMVYGHRRPPFSVRAVISKDQCKTWDTTTVKEIYRSDVKHIDFGYPVATQLDDGTVFCTFYGFLNDEPSFKAPHAIYGTFFNEQWLMQQDQ